MALRLSAMGLVAPLALVACSLAHPELAPGAPAASPGPAPQPLRPSTDSSPVPSVFQPPAWVGVVAPKRGAARVHWSGGAWSWAGLPLAGVEVRAFSLDPQFPYRGTALSDAEGRWAFTHLPSGAPLRVEAGGQGSPWGLRDGGRWVLHAGPGNGVLNFGQAIGQEGADWPSVVLGLVDHPEVVDVALLPDASGVTLRLNKALNSANLRRLAMALRLVPREPDLDGASGVAQGDRHLWPWAWQADLEAKAPAALPPPAPPRGHPGLARVDALGTVSWAADGLSVTWAWGPLPPKAASGQAEWQLALVADLDPIRDEAGRAMGLDAALLGPWTQPGRLVPFPFAKAPGPAPEAADGEASGDAALRRRWAWGHRNAWPLKLAP